MIRIFAIAALSLVGFASASTAQTADDYLFTMMAESQTAELAEDAATKRDHLIAAAYAARRLVEDFPRSPDAMSLKGAGIAVFGGDPVTFGGVTKALTDACIAAPNALCATDVFYASEEQRLEPILKDAFKSKRELNLKEENFGTGWSEHRVFAAMVYAELGLADRTQATFAHHQRVDGLLTILERAVWAPRYTYALVRIGDDDTASRIMPEILASVTGNEKLERMLHFYPVLVSRANAVALMTSGRSGEVSDGFFEKEIRGIFREAIDYHSLSHSEEVRAFLQSKVADCVEMGRIAERTCTRELGAMHAAVGDFDSIIEVAEMSRAPDSVKQRAEGVLLQAVYYDLVMKLIRDRGLEGANLSAIASIALWNEDEDFLEFAIKRARESEPDRRDGAISSIASTLAEFGEFDRARELANEISDEEIRNNTQSGFSQDRFYGLMNEGEYGVVLERILQTEELNSGFTRAQLIARLLHDRNVR